ncbi:hypothetical protein [Amycolatopsis taiwanensis]|uniref:Anti-bacteriophage protein A/HamA C-terminal domain-containing protein n=1 Tax=Amycolatopsis taiwanensis TaxID=342230 RepID=A0A9W6RCS7_9PSEU|nr:hypothetical protein [Amycolatopsis taiwanensis]GLY71717.1 hypothetical protein Atai01_83360 [Amycolatopsis taiwanensis]
MKELGVDLAEVHTFFSEGHDTPFVLVKVAPERTEEWTKMLGVPARRCYISDAWLKRRVEETTYPHETIVEAVIPSKGSVMAGDYGEIMTALYLAAMAHPTDVLDPKMWRLKSGRTKASQGSDVVQFQLPQWPGASSDDKVVCAEVKTKSTSGQSTPVASAIEDSRKDRESRLVKTLVWLKERAIREDLGTVEVCHLDRFIKATDYPPAVYEFRAVAVISSELVDDELLDITVPEKDHCTLVVISVPDLKANYESLYEVLLANAAVGVDAP